MPGRHRRRVWPFVREAPGGCRPAQGATCARRGSSESPTCLAPRPGARAEVGQLAQRQVDEVDAFSGEPSGLLRSRPSKTCCASRTAAPHLGRSGPEACGRNDGDRVVATTRGPWRSPYCGATPRWSSAQLCASSADRRGLIPCRSPSDTGRPGHCLPVPLSFCEGFSHGPLPGRTHIQEIIAAWPESEPAVWRAGAASLPSRATGGEGAAAAVARSQ